MTVNSASLLHDHQLMNSAHFFFSFFPQMVSFISIVIISLSAFVFFFYKLNNSPTQGHKVNDLFAAPFSFVA